MTMVKNHARHWVRRNAEIQAPQAGSAPRLGRQRDPTIPLSHPHETPVKAPATP